MMNWLRTNESNYELKPLVYAARIGKKWTVYIDGVPDPPVDKLLGLSLCTSADGKHYAYVAKNGRDWFVVVDGQPGPTFSRIRTMKKAGLFDVFGKQQNVVYAGKREHWYACTRGGSSCRTQ